MPEPKKQPRLYSQKVLGSVIDFLVSAGFDSKTIRETVDRRLAAASRKTSVRRKSRGRGDDTVSAAILHRWHRDRDLIDDNASPRPLKLFGARHSVEALIRSELPSSSPRVIIENLRSLGLLKEVAPGKFLPKARVATIGTMHPVLIEHVAKSLMRLLETVNQNTSLQPGAVPLIERFTHIPDLPLSRADEFRGFAQQHGSAFLASVDDWLEARRVRNSRKKEAGTAAGVHVYAYIERPKKPRPTRAKRA